MNIISIKIFLTLYFLLYYGILFVLNSILVFKQTGKNPYVLGQSKGLIGFVEKSIKLIGIIIPTVLVVYIFFPGIYSLIMPINYVEDEYFDYIGITIMMAGFSICLTAQFYMQSSWKIGIEKNAEVGLVTKGIFRHSRNPFFLGTILSYIGFFFVLPNTLSFTVGVVYVFLIQIQVRLEEENLIKLVGQNYQNYCSKVRRWV